MWYICFAAALAVCALTLYALWLRQFHHGAKKRVLSSLHLVILAVFAASTILFLPLHALTSHQTFWFAQALETLLISMHHALQLFTLGSSFDVILAATEAMPESLTQIYPLIFALLFIAAPLMTLAFVLSLFQNTWAQLRLLVGPKTHLYLFSSLNERSLTLAESLWEKDHPCIVFAQANTEDATCLAQAKAMHAICVKQRIETLRLPKQNRNGTLTCFMMDEHEADNVKAAMAFLARFHDRDNCSLYVFAQAAESELLLSNTNKGKIKVRRIHEARSFIYRTLYENGSQLFAHAHESANGKKLISVVIVGLGEYGTMLLKTLPWFCQMDGYRLQIDAFDAAADARERFCAMCPELMDETHNGSDIPGEAHYHIRIHSHTDLHDASFMQSLHQLKQTGFVYVMLEQEEEAIETAMSMRMQFARINLHPRIYAMLHDSEKKEVLAHCRNHQGQPYDITWIADHKSLYHASAIMNNELEQEALRRHLKWGDEEAFWTYEYYYRSSMAAALHRLMRIAVHMQGAEKREEELTVQEQQALKLLEHRRWNAYMRSEGYIYSGSLDPTSRNELAKMHHNLVPFAQLSEADKRKDVQVGSQ